MSALSPSSARRQLLAFVTIVLSLVLADRAQACPSCPIGRQARAQVWDCDFGQNLFFAVLPFVVIGLVCVCVERIDRAQVFT